MFDNVLQCKKYSNVRGFWVEVKSYCVFGAICSCSFVSFMTMLYVVPYSLAYRNCSIIVLLSMNCSFEWLPQPCVNYFNAVPTLLFCHREFSAWDLKLFVISVKIWSSDVLSVSNGFRYFYKCLLRVHINAQGLLRMDKIVSVVFPHSFKSFISMHYLSYL